MLEKVGRIKQMNAQQSTPYEAAAVLEKEATELHAQFSVLEEFNPELIKPHHWERVGGVMKNEAQQSNSNPTIGDLLQTDLGVLKMDVEALMAEMLGEYKIEAEFKRIQHLWLKTMKFRFRHLSLTQSCGQTSPTSTRPSSTPPSPPSPSAQRRTAPPRRWAAAMRGGCSTRRCAG